MNSGAEAVETAIKAVRKWGYEVKGVPEGQAEIIVCDDNFHGRTLGVVSFSTDPDARGNFGPFAAGVRVSAVRRRRRAGGGDHARTRSASSSSRSRARRGSSSRPRATSARVREICTRGRGDADPRRDPDRARADRQAARRGARGDRGGRDADRQGARRRLLSGVGGALQLRRARRAEARAARLDLRRQPARLRGGARVAEGAGRGGADRAVGRARRLFPRRASRRSARTGCARCAGAA